MSYTVEVDATKMPPEFATDYRSAPTVYVTTFGDGDRGRMVQLSTGFEDFACLTMDQVDALIDVLQHARQRSLSDHRLYLDRYEDDPPLPLPPFESSPSSDDPPKSPIGGDS